MRVIHIRQSGDEWEALDPAMSPQAQTYQRWARYASAESARLGVGALLCELGVTFRFLEFPLTGGRYYARRDGKIAASNTFEGLVDVRRHDDDQFASGAYFLVNPDTGRVEAAGGRESPYDVLYEVPDVDRVETPDKPTIDPVWAALTKGKTVQFARKQGDLWVDLSRDPLAPGMVDAYHALVFREGTHVFRVKPKLVSINGAEIIAPLRELPAKGTRGFTPNFLTGIPVALEVGTATGNAEAAFKHRTLFATASDCTIFMNAIYEALK